ncbi:hypothetical protein [Dysgonomonas sp. BGC7]|uniref:hypothetical protein n=1 Tax=Dysgonomonas sp. BGC7 TaxID=1658008 RepID=UPI0006800637|nr:hypothetical protein [Dysgonomonas sp. BGC7]MBD8388712.1 hypothetical protein [Dysgonomonas sp. BGC7]
MKNLIFYFTIISIVLTSSCKVQKPYLGTYVSDNWEYFEIKGNNEFSYRYRHEWFYRYSNGSWTFDKEKQRVHLTSNLSDLLNIPISVKATEKENSFIQFYFPNLIDKFKAGNIKWEVYINNKPYPIQTGDTSFLVIREKIEIDSLYFQASVDNKGWFSSPDYSKIRSEVYKVKGTGLNHFEIFFSERINLYIFHYLPIIESIQVKRKSLIWNRIGDDGKMYKIKYKFKKYSDSQSK